MADENVAKSAEIRIFPIFYRRFYKNVRFFQVTRVLKKLSLEHKTLKMVMKKMNDMMDLGLSDNEATRERSSLKMLPSFVCALPDGSETGDVLALDLGGTNFRVLVVTLKPDRKAAQDSKIFVVPHQCQVGTGEQVRFSFSLIFNHFRFF